VLVYITCSILVEENSRQAADFLAAHADFSAIPGHSLWHSHFSGVQARAHFSPEGGVALTPHSTGTDGFYVIVFMRNA
jgi:16S rRNA (cytosine967-C5)-methyltransferase